MVDRPARPVSEPLSDLDQWEEDLLRRYPDPTAAGEPVAAKTKEQFRDYRAEAGRGEAGREGDGSNS